MNFRAWNSIERRICSFVYKLCRYNSQESMFHIEKTFIKVIHDNRNFIIWTRKHIGLTTIFFKCGRYFNFVRVYVIVRGLVNRIRACTRMNIGIEPMKHIILLQLLYHCKWGSSALTFVLTTIYVDRIGTITLNPGFLDLSKR